MIDPASPGGLRRASDRPLLATFEAEGWAICPAVVARPDLERLAASLPPVPRGGVRNLLTTCPEARAFCQSPGVRTIVEEAIGPAAVVVRAILFDKTPSANWSVPFHQDTTIAVRERVTVDGFGPWSVKEGVPHVQPPAAVLERMVTVRIHVDRSDESNGPLIVIPGSHRHGILDDAEIARRRSTTAPMVCLAAAGDAVVMRPLLLHASPRALNPAHRRVIHLEYAGDPLPSGLEWARP